MPHRSAPPHPNGHKDRNFQWFPAPDLNFQITTSRGCDSRWLHSPATSFAALVNDPVPHAYPDPFPHWTSGVSGVAEVPASLEASAAGAIAGVSAAGLSGIGTFSGSPTGATGGCSSTGAETAAGASVGNAAGVSTADRPEGAELSRSPGATAAAGVSLVGLSSFEAESVAGEGGGSGGTE